MFDKLFNWGKKKTAAVSGPAVTFGRYSDNNKPPSKINRWTDADRFYREKKYPEQLDAFFDYLKDDQTQNVAYERNGTVGSFQLYQGSKIVRGRFDETELRAEVTLAGMPQPSIPVMRRLLEQNFSLYYSRFALDSDRLCMRFDSTLAGANPTKLYHALKELSIKADKQDDLLVQDFASLQTTDSEHIIPLSDTEKTVRYQWMQQWITATLDQVAALDADKFSGGISYLLLCLVFRIDYLITPEGQLLSQLEKISSIYFRQEQRVASEVNRDMISAIKALAALPKEAVVNNLFHSRYTFSVTAPQAYKTVVDSIQGALQNMIWYRDNNYPFIANQVMEYGIAFCQYSYSLPKVITELFDLFMQVNYSDYCHALGASINYYDRRTNDFNGAAIAASIRNIQEKWLPKYPGLDFRIHHLRYDNLVNFNHSFCAELQLLNIEGK